MKTPSAPNAAGPVGGGLDWDDLRFVLVVADTGALAAAARVLGVDHTTVGRRLEGCERQLGLRLFTRNTTGLSLTADGERVLAPLRDVELAVAAVLRAAEQTKTVDAGVSGVVRVTAPETFGVAWLAPALTRFGLKHPALQVELAPSGAMFDLGRQQAEIAVRMFRSRADGLVAAKAGVVAYGLYASAAVASQSTPTTATLHQHRVVCPRDAKELELRWLRQLNPQVAPTFCSEVSLALLEVVKADGGFAVLPCYLADAAGLVRVHLDGAPPLPEEPIWLTAHKDLRHAPRVRATFDFLRDAIAADADRLSGVVKAVGVATTPAPRRRPR